MNKNIGPAFLCLFFCLSFSGVALAQTPVFGVSIGDKFTYNCTLLGTHNETLSWEPWMQERNQSRWEVTVTDVAGTRVTFQLQIFPTNGTVENFPSQFVDLYSGGANGPNYMFFISSNLNVSDQIYPGGANYFVNDTLTRNYASGQRTTNHINFASPLDYRDAYNDKTTGVLVEFTATYFDLAGTFNLKLINSSLWMVSTSPTTSPTTTPTNTSPTATAQTSPQVPEFPSIAILSFFVVFALLSAIIYKRKAKERASYEPNKSSFFSFIVFVAFLNQTRAR